ncbi:serine/threonine-protein kinase [Streptomyces oceani]|uniref:non-specific serine/threonine protein kinase n=1 Tax=Streptomyces oceani TaxID=1075402 RepID=A0A1E7JY21_9ACTN|nr:serine/threonine-protein kinase [Streptomyces oceani]OEU96564.1 serine/threonine protein kinase [Streptomyces oceani]
MHTTPLSPEDPVTLGGFELQARIGQGGMGRVFLGESPGGEPAAVKVIKPSVVDSESRLRFAQEVEVLKTVWGPRIAALMGYDAEAEQPWLATEYVEGADLGKHVKVHGPMGCLLVAALGAILAETLASVHDQGLLHRDLKPANVLLGPNGPKIIDFGLAVFAESSISLTAPDQVVGTPVCMAPEQAANLKPLSSAVDVYSLGAVLLFAATGHYPYRAATPYLVFQQVTDPNAVPDLSGAPEELTPLLADMLARSAEDRPSLTEVVRHCRSLIEAQGMKIAQARRRLTAYATSMAQQDVPEAADLGGPLSTAPFPALSTVSDPPRSGQEGGTRPDSEEPRTATSQPSDTTGRDTPEPPSSSVCDSPVSATGPERSQPEPREPQSPHLGRQRSASVRHTVLHSKQARTTAAQLRRTYAAGAPF